MHSAQVCGYVPGTAPLQQLQLQTYKPWACLLCSVAINLLPLCPLQLLEVEERRLVERGLLFWPAARLAIPSSRAIASCNNPFLGEGRGRIGFHKLVGCKAGQPPASSSCAAAPDQNTCAALCAALSQLPLSARVWTERTVPTPARAAVFVLLIHVAEPGSAVNFPAATSS
jgi:hypothetical protein